MSQFRAGEIEMQQATNRQPTEAEVKAAQDKVARSGAKATLLIVARDMDERAERLKLDAIALRRAAEIL